MSTTTEIVDQAHSIYSASGSKRWLTCPGSIWLSKQVPKEPTSVYAKAGSAAHYVSECIQRDNMDEDEALNALETHNEDWYKVFLEQDRDDFFNSVWVYVNYMRERIEMRPAARAMYEQKVRMGFIHPAMFGTADFLHMELFDMLESADFKHGKGVPVDVEEAPGVENANSQQAYYLLCSADQYAYNFEKVRMTIVQPRAPHVEGAIRYREYDMEEFRLVWTEKFRRGVAHVEEARTAPTLDPYLNAGDHCGFCPARAVCPALRQKTYELAQMDFDPITLDADRSEGTQLPDPATLTPQQLKLVLDHSKMIDGWIKGVEQHAQKLLESGDKVPGYKLVTKRPTRKWIDPEKVRKRLARRKTITDEDYLTAPKMLSPAQMETRHKKNNPKLWKSLEGDIHKVSSGRTIAKEDDKRPALEHQKAQDDFDAIEA